MVVRPMQKRVLVDELLDILPADDPAAIHSRADLRKLNSLMGSYRWFLERIGDLAPDGEPFRVVELGAGDGTLAKQIHAEFPNVQFTAIDLAPEPEDWPESYVWRQGDLFEQGDALQGDLLIANLFLHHFTEEQLRNLGKLIGNFRHIATSEPARFWQFHIMAFFANALGINYVTRHDMHVSINAGFRGEELAEALSFDENWSIRSWHSRMGSHRLEGSRVST